MEAIGRLLILYLASRGLGRRGRFREEGGSAKQPVKCGGTAKTAQGTRMMKRGGKTGRPKAKVRVPQRKNVTFKKCRVAEAEVETEERDRRRNDAVSAEMRRRPRTRDENLTIRSAKGETSNREVRNKLSVG